MVRELGGPPELVRQELHLPVGCGLYIRVRRRFLKLDYEAHLKLLSVSKAVTFILHYCLRFFPRAHASTPQTCFESGLTRDENCAR